jgi:TRAP-type C4-dicarboxylate transport system substrate-binding protein
MTEFQPKKATGAVAAICAAFLIAGVSSASLAADKPSPVTIRIASDFSPAPHPAGISLEYFKEELAKAIPGSELRIFTAGALYKVPEAVEAMTDGNLEMTWGQFGKSSQIDPYSSLVNGPMLLTTPGAMNELDNFETYKFLKKRFSDIHGVKLFGSGHLSMYVGLGAGERILKPADLKGKKIRSMGPAENVTLETWGANAVTMAFGDVPPALETKVIDGLVTSLGGFSSTKDQAPFFTIAGINGITGDYYWIGASEAWWNKLDKPTQDTLQTLIVEKVIPFSKKINWCNDKRVIDKYGTKDPSKPGIYILSPEQQEAFASQLGTATTEWVKSKTPDDANKWADKFVQEAKAASKAHPMGSSELEKTDCAQFKPWFDRFVKK